MISKNKRYRFSKDTLQFEAVRPSLKTRLSAALGFLLRTSLFAFVLILISIVTGFSPIGLIQQKRIKNYTEKYNLLSGRLDSLQLALHSNHFSSDNLYRQLLELDSIPSTIRYAGTGGTDPFQDYFGSLDKDILLSLTQKIDLLNNQLKLQDTSFDTISKEIDSRNKQYKEIPHIPPVKPGRYIWLSSYYGTRTDPFTFLRRYHKGLDFVGPRNTEIFATANGTVTLTKHSRRGYGNEILISHSFGYSTRYAHLQEILVEEGQEVKIGQLIGKMGSTGRSTGTHLHYEVRLNKRTVNPIYYYSDDLSPEEYELITKRTD